MLDALLLVVVRGVASLSSVELLPLFLMLCCIVLANEDNFVNVYVCVCVCASECDEFVVENLIKDTTC